MNVRFLRICLTIFASFAAPVMTLAGGEESLSLQRYVQIVLEHNPQVRGSAASVEQSAAGVEKSRSNLLPSINGSADVSRSGNLSPATGSTSAGASVRGSILLYDFGRTPTALAISRKGLESAEADRTGVIQQLIVDAQTAYFSYILKQQLLSVSEESLKLKLDQLTQAKALFEVGRQPKLAVTKAEVDVANAQVGLVTARSAGKLARLQLEATAGVPLADQVILTDTIDGTGDSVDRETALKTALNRRPEITMANNAVESGTLQVRIAQLSYLPNLNGSASLSTGYNEGYGTSQGWSAGASATIPIFEGGATQAGVRSARAAQQNAEADRDTKIQSITTEIEQVLLTRSTALEQISAATVLVQQAAEGLLLSQEQFKAGLAAPLVVTDAEATLDAARSTLAQARYDFHIAQVNLAKAMGILKP
jgi:outer membrane protein TolC